MKKGERRKGKGEKREDDIQKQQMAERMFVLPSAVSVSVQSESLGLLSVVLVRNG